MQKLNILREKNIYIWIFQLVFVFLHQIIIKNMKLLFVIKSFAQVAGVERVMADKMNYFASSGHTILLVTYEQGSHPLIFSLHPTINHIDLDCRFFTLHNQPYVKRFFESLIMKLRFYIRIKKIIKNFKPDSVISPTYPLSIIGELASAKGDAKLIFESHGAYVQAFKEFCNPQSLSEKLIAKIHDRIALKALSKCDYLAALTKGDCNFWAQHIPNTCVIPNPLTYYPETINDVQKDHNRIISIGRLTSIKRFDRLIEAFALIHQNNPLWHIDIYGEGSDKPQLNDIITKFGLTNRIIIHPPTNNIFSEMKKSQILVMTSESEGFPLVLIEAMACGTPCLSFNCPYGPSEIIEHNKNGILAKNGDIQDLAKQMQYLMNNPKIVEEMSKNARSSAMKYKKEKVMKAWESLYSGDGYE